MFMRMRGNGRIKQKIPNNYFRWKNRPIAMIGCGPSTISCATYLARFGYKNITIFERNAFGGGLLSTEIPQNRLSFECVNFEIELIKELGVKIEYNKELGKDFSITDLQKQFEVIFLGIGLSEPILPKEFQKMDEKNGYYTSKSFLTKVTRASKVKICRKCGGTVCTCYELPELKGKVVVLGAGDVAMDCAGSAIRCGAEKVSIILRREFGSIRATPDERDSAIHEKINFLTECTVKDVVVDTSGHIIGLELIRMETTGSGKCQVEGFDKNLFGDSSSTFFVKCDYVISAFGSKFGRKNFYPLKLLSEDEKKKLGIENRKNIFGVSEEMKVPSRIPIWMGGDVAGKGTVVEAVADGKISSWSIHRFFSKKYDKNHSLGPDPQLPKFVTEIDDVDLSVNFLGKKICNPFGLASAPLTGTKDQMKRAYEENWGFLVTKTCLYGKEITNISPRIVKRSNTPRDNCTFVNIDLFSEKGIQYYVDAVKKIKKEFPDKMIIFGATSSHHKEENWREMGKIMKSSGPDGVELSLSCPHSEHGNIGTNVEEVAKIIEWVKEEVGDIPVFAKMTPNATPEFIVKLAETVKNQNGSGVTCSNSVSVIGQILPNSKGWPGVDGVTTGGGQSGTSIHEIVNRMIVDIYQKENLVSDDFCIFGAGGVDSSETAMEFLLAGATYVQVCSGVQNSSFKMVEELEYGLKALLFVYKNPNFEEWEGQSPPIEDRWRKGEYFESSKDVKVTVFPSLVSSERKDHNVLSVNDIIGNASSINVKGHGELDPEIEKYSIPEIDEDLCVRCGRCFAACSDSANQAIVFNKDNKWIPQIVEKRCFGCFLCEAVCPVKGALLMKERKTKYIPNRN